MLANIIMKILLTSIILFAFETATFFQYSENDKKIQDSLKVEILNLEKKLFDLPVDGYIDTNAIYSSVYEQTVSREFKANSSLSRKKHSYYMKKDSDTVYAKELLIEDSGKFFKNNLILSKDPLFKLARKHSFDGMLGTYIIGFDKNYLILIRCFTEPPIYQQSFQTSPAHYIEEYKYYKRIN